MSIPPHEGDDPWQLRHAEAVAQQPALLVETVKGIHPLDTQLGAFPKKTVPDVLHDLMFGQLDPSLAEIEATGGDPALLPPMRTYAVLDAAKVANLPELLEQSDLEHRCLFKGGAYDELRDVAPWIVQLEDDNSFTRNLFTRSDAPWHLWDTEPGIYVRSRSTLDEMWKHFRKFTRVQDESGKWFYWRFWDSRALLSFLAASDFSPMAQQFLLRQQRLPSSICLLLPQENTVSLLTVQHASTEMGPAQMLVLTNQDRQGLREELRRRDAAKLAGFLATQPVLGQSDPDYLNDLALRSLIRRDEMGVRSPNGVAWMVVLLYLADRHARAAKGLSLIMQSRTWGFDQVARMLKRGADKARSHEKRDT